MMRRGWILLIPLLLSGCGAAPFVRFLDTFFPGRIQGSADSPLPRPPLGQPIPLPPGNDIAPPPKPSYPPANVPPLDPVPSA